MGHRDVLFNARPYKGELFSCRGDGAENLAKVYVGFPGKEKFAGESSLE
jgi:hypothetical protein